jgi:hypothetical protein
MRRIAAALREFVDEQGWQPGDYQILLRVLEDWGRITVLFVARDFGGLSKKDMWARVWAHLNQSLQREGDIGISVGLILRSRDQVDQGGPNSIPEGFLEEELVLGSSASA